MVVLVVVVVVVVMVVMRTAATGSAWASEAEQPPTADGGRWHLVVIGLFLRLQRKMQ
jgi:hypothetical protein